MVKIWGVIEGPASAHDMLVYSRFNHSHWQSDSIPTYCLHNLQLPMRTLKHCACGAAAYFIWFCVASNRLERSTESVEDKLLHNLRPRLRWDRLGSSRLGIHDLLLPRCHERSQSHKTALTIVQAALSAFHAKVIASSNTNVCAMLLLQTSIHNINCIQLLRIITDTRVSLACTKTMSTAGHYDRRIRQDWAAVGRARQPGPPARPTGAGQTSR